MAVFRPRKLPSKQGNQKVGTFQLVDGFKGYQSRIEQTRVTPDTLTPPSLNVVMGTSGRIAPIKGYVLDGAGSSVADSGILSHYDFPNFRGIVQNLRAGFLSSAANDGKLQFRTVTGTTVTWINLKTALTTVKLSFAEFWDTTELKKLLLWVDGSSNINEWNGATTTLASATTLSTSVIGTITAAPPAGGNSYAVGDILSINTGIGGRVQVASVTGNAVLTFTLLDVGTSGYAVATFATSAITGVGTGATVSVATIQTAATITKQGTLTWAQAGFYQTRNKSVTINNVTQAAYGYQYGYDTLTLTGVTPDPSLAGYAVGSVIFQTPIITPLSSMTAILATFSPTVIGSGRNNQLYVGSSTSNNLYISKVNNYQNYAFTQPVRVVGEGFIVSLDAPPIKFIPQEMRTDNLAYDVYISEGTDRWAVMRSTLSTDLTTERLEHIRLKVSPLQGAKSERLAGKMKNHIVFLGNDNVMNFLGFMSYQYIPELVDFSYPIIDDMKAYDFTDGEVFYFSNYIYVSVPKSGLVLIYNMTDQTKETTSSLRGIEDIDQQPWFWEAPVGYPVSGFYVVNGVLYGHSYTSSESYKLFTGGSFNTQNIAANATFGFDDKGDRTASKTSNELWVEGYIKQNTTLAVAIGGDLGTFSSPQNKTISGTDSGIVAYGAGAHALGKNNLGSQPLGGANISTTTLPAWFHVILTYIATPVFLEQITFSTNGVDLQWELITYGSNSSPTAEGNNNIKR